MGFEIKTAKLVAEPGEKIWGQAVSFKDFLVVIELRAEAEVVAKGREVLDQVLSLYQEVKPKNLETLKKIKTKIKIEDEIFLNLILGLLKDRVLYLSCLGDCHAIVKRKEKTAVVLKEEKEASGVLEVSDIVVLTSPNFNKTISLPKLKDSFDDLDAEEIAEKLAPFLHKDKESLGSAALIFKVYPKEEEKEVIEEAEEELLEQEEKSILTKFLKKFRLSYQNYGFKIRRETRERISRKTLNTVAIFLIFLLITSIFLGIRKKNEAVRIEKFSQVYSLAQHKFEEGEALLDLNPVRSRTLLSEAKDLLEENKEEFKKDTEKAKKIEALYEKIRANLGLAAKVYKLEELPLFFDLSLIKKEARGEKMALYKDNLVVLDKQNNTVYQISISKISQATVAGGKDLKEPIDITVHGDKVFILTKEEVFKTTLISKKLSVALEKEEKWGEIVDLASYAGNLYLLDKAQNQIFKYIATESGFSKIRNYLNPDVSVNFGNGKNLAIDGSIWVLTSEQIYKFTQGRPDLFKTKGLEEKLENPDYLFTDEESSNLYVLEKEKQRIVVFDKDGLYQAQYFHEEIGKAQEIVVSEKEKKILVLSENKIYAMEIKD